ncbi:MAG TPA: hypothetical protein O0X25_01780 [Methanocorpusculum sp.]|nr:hypothetical protein [Methanocorpusculum sp.]HJJ39727.1 hypothetical protein [Methanocorpusculum sp.]HJJ49336.1 hypothetical protein [Methanocorpusculum sp.]HJJ56620.1 hypothetical protein [Methanocorpusculum sp.]
MKTLIFDNVEDAFRFKSELMQTGTKEPIIVSMSGCDAGTPAKFSVTYQEDEA